MMTVQTNASQTQPIDCQIDFLSRQVAAAEEARRHAQTVSSELVQEKRALEQKLTEATARINWLTTYYDLSSVAYDNACLRAKEAEERAHKAEAALADHLADVVKMVEPETISTVTAWADETFGLATIDRQILRAEMEFQELLHISQTNTGKIAEEAADVVICLYRVIGTLDKEAINKKMAKNRARKWRVDGQGCAQHVGEE